MIICPSSWRDIPVPENRLLLVKARALIISYSGTDISCLYIPGEFSDSQTHGYFGGKRCFGLFFLPVVGTKKTPQLLKTSVLQIQQDKKDSRCIFVLPCAHNALQSPCVLTGITKFCHFIPVTSIKQLKMIQYISFPLLIHRLFHAHL